MEDWVFVDSCVWTAFFGKSNSSAKAAVGNLVDADRVAIVGPIVAEVLLGFRRKDQADWVSSRLRMAHYVETSWDDWRVASELGRGHAANGNKLPLTDLLVASAARRRKAWVYSTDPHFDLFQGLKRYQPGK
jgi:predicted nucleic acid-binding protein